MSIPETPKIIRHAYIDTKTKYHESMILSPYIKQKDVPFVEAIGTNKR